MKKSITYENKNTKQIIENNRKKIHTFILEKILKKEDVITHINSYGQIGEEPGSAGWRGYYIGAKEQNGKLIPATIKDGACIYQGDIRSEEHYNLFNSSIKIREVKDSSYNCINFDIVIPTQFYENEGLSKKVFTTDSRGNANTNITILIKNKGESEETIQTMRENQEIFLEFYRFVLPEQFKAYEELRNHRTSEGYFEMIKNKFNKENVRKNLEDNLDFYKKGVDRYLEEKEEIQKEINRTKRKKNILKFFCMKSSERYSEQNRIEDIESKSFENNEKRIKHFENLKKDEEKNLEILRNSPEEFLKEYQGKIMKRDYPEFMIKDYSLEHKK